MRVLRRQVESPDTESETTPTGWVGVMPWVFSAVAAATSLAATVNGPGLSPDSVSYLSAAESLQRHGTLLTSEGVTLTQFPPGYPIVLRVLMLFGFSSTGAARVVAAVCAGLIVLLAWRLAMRWALPTHLACIVALVCLGAPALSANARWAWSEPPLIVVVLLIALRLDDVKRRGGSASTRDVVVLAALCGAGTLFRYAGIGLIPGVAIALLLLDRAGDSRDVRGAVRATIRFALLATLVPGLLMLRNQISTGHFGGPEFLPVGGVLDDLRQVALTLGNWVLPGVTLSVGSARAVGFIVLVALAVGGALTLRRSEHLKRLPGGVLIILPLVLTLYAWVLVSARVTWVVIDSRMLSPTLPLLALLVGVALSAPTRRAIHKWLLAGGTLAFGLSAVLGIQDTVDKSEEAIRHGSGYAGDIWSDSTLVEATRTAPSTAVVYSNLPDAIWSVTGRVPVKMSPQATGVSDDVRTEQLEAFLTAACEDEVYLAWFEMQFRTELFTPEALLDRVDLVPTTIAGDGTLYRVSVTDASVACDG